jgi:protein-disulfide isomerase
VSQPRARRSVPRRVYTILAPLGLVLATSLALAPALAQIELTMTPAMTQGPAQAPVTIVEFSDYQ